ncbi:MAG TPA: DNA primase [Candidatus Omnitrophota bacterium]|nr:DNA primase [Candidatus Omnitrophota bacterium]
MIPQEIIDETLNRCDIVEVISAYVPLKKAGRNFKGLSPFNHEKTASFFVSPDKQIFHCFSSGIGGNVITFVMKMERMDFPEAVRFLAKRVGVVIPESKSNAKTDNIRQAIFNLNETAVHYYHSNLLETNPEAQKAREYLAKRQISQEIIDTFKLGFASERWDGLLRFLEKKNVSLRLMEQAGLIIANKKQEGFFDCFRNRIIFPIFDTQGNCRAFGARTMEEDNPVKYINSPETSIYTKGHHLYGFHLAKETITKSDFVIMVEGYVDCIMPYQAGVRNIVASLGTALTLEQIRLIRRYTKNVIMLYDTDRAGEAAMLRSLDMLIEEGLNVKVVTLEEGEDPDSYIQKYGAKAFAGKINSAKTLFDYKLQVLLNKCDVKTVEGKAVIAGEMLPTIEKFNNAVMQTGYLQRLSKVLLVPEEALMTELKKVREVASKRVSKTPEAREQSAQEQFRTAEFNMLQLLLEDQRFIPLTKEVMELADFQDKKIREVISKIFELFEEGKEISSVRLMNSFEDESIVRLISRLLAEEEKVLGDLDRMHRDIIVRIKEDRRKRFRQELLQQIREAEQNGDQKRLEELKTEFNQFTKK